MSEPPQRPCDLTPLALFCAVLSLCLLFYAGRTFVIDDFTLLASAANLGNAGRLDINELAYTHWDLPPPSGLGAFGPTGDYFAKKAPAPAWLAAPLYRLGMLAPWLGNTTTALLLSPMLTAATTVLIYDLARRMGYTRAASLAGGLLYGGASMALVYSRFLLGEPVMAFGLTLAIWGAWLARRDGREVAGPLIGGLGLGLAAGVGLALAALAPVFVAYFVLSDSPFPSLRAEVRACVRRVLWYGAALGACLALVAAYNQARFGTILESGYHFAAGEGFSTPLGLGIFGLLLSPARGLFWFNPLTWLALPGWWLWRRRGPTAEAWLALALVAAQTVIFSAWWSWAGGVSWGPRFLLPAVPFLTLAGLPALDRARTHRLWAARLWVALVVVVVVAAAGVQLVGATADVNIYEGQLDADDPHGANGPPGYPHGWRALADPALSPILGNVRLLVERGPALAWVRAGDVDWLAVLALASACATSVISLVSSGSESSPHPYRRLVITAAALTLVAANVALSRLPTPATGGGGQPLQAIPAALADHEPGDVMLALTPDLSWALVELAERPPGVGLPRGAWREDPLANALFDRALAGARRAWLLTYDSPPPSWYEDRLRDAGEAVDERSLDGYRLAIYKLD